MVVTFYLATLGCKVNQYESHALREAWTNLGWLETSAPEQAKLILVNSCAVTARAVADVRATVRRLHRAAPGASIIITGCAAEVLATELADLPGVTAVVGQSRKEKLLSEIKAIETPTSVAELEEGTELAKFAEIAACAEDTAGAPATAFPAAGESASKAWNVKTAVPFPAFTVSGYDRSRAVLKVQDGCSHRCTYCIVPLTRGKARSRAIDDSLSEANRLLKAGFREIVISGVNLRQYGWKHVPGEMQKPADTGGHDFWDLLARLDAELSPDWAGRARLRVSSLEPGQLGQKALDVLGASKLAAPHLHLSLQSGSPSVLKRMGRGHYDPGTMPAFFSALRAIWPVFGLGADILTAFPGESEEEFQEGLALCQSLPLTYAHVFPYSRRPGTAAAAMPGQLPASVKKERAAVLRAMVREKKTAFLRSLLDVPLMHVVFEDRGETHEGTEAPNETGKTDQSVAEKANGKAKRAEHPRSGVARGVNDWYADCRLDVPSDLAAPLSRVLTPVRPLSVEGELLLVGGAE